MLGFSRSVIGLCFLGSPIAGNRLTFSLQNRGFLVLERDLIPAQQIATRRQISASPRTSLVAH